MARLFLRSTIIILFVLSMCLVHSVAAKASTVSTKSAGPLQIEQYGVFNAVVEISQKAHVAISVDAIMRSKEPTVKLNFPGGKVADLLNMLLMQAPDYGWNEAPDGVIHVFRKGAQVSLLDVAMSYPGAQMKTRQEIWKDLSSRPEILQWLTSNRCTRQEYFMGKEFRWNNDPISISSGTLTVRQLFDEVTIKSGSDGWLVLQSPLSSASCNVSLMLW